MEKNVTVYGTKFNLEDYEDVNQLHELEKMNVFGKLAGNQKLEAESELFNRIYAWNNDVDGHKSEVKVMSKIGDVVSKEVVAAPPAPLS